MYRFGNDPVSSLKVLLTHPEAKLFGSLGTPDALFQPDPGRLSKPDNSSVFRIEEPVPNKVRFTAARGLTSSDEIYYFHRADGSLLVSDSFRALVSCIPVADRRVADAAVADHLLFRTTPGTQTYLDGVFRLGHGNQLEWDNGSLKVHVKRGGSVPICAPEYDAHAMRRLDEALKASVQDATGGEDWCNLLSGGIDSTLLHTYLGQHVPSVSAASDSPEFAREIEYARAASRMLGTQHRLVIAREADYLSDLESCIDALSLPPHHLQTVLVDHAIQGADRDGLVTGQLADALFGIDASLHARRVWSVRLWLRVPGIGFARRFLGSQWKERVRRWDETVRRLRLPPEDPESFAMRFATFGDIEGTKAMLGEHLVRERFVARLEYVRNRVELPVAKHPVDAQLELGHWIDFFCDDTVSIWRQLAHARGKRLLAPFTSTSVVEASRCFALATRYLARGEVKPVLKALLAERLTSYPVKQRKGGSGLPIRRYLADGPLQTVLTDYPMPGFIDSRTRKRLLGRALLDHEVWMAWNVAVFAIWQERVLRHSLPTLPHWRQHVVQARSDMPRR